MTQTTVRTRRASRAEAYRVPPSQFRLRDSEAVEAATLEELLLLASSHGHRQLCACAILKVMHIIHHLAGRELLFRLPVSDPRSVSPRGRESLPHRGDDAERGASPSPRSSSAAEKTWIRRTPKLFVQGRISTAAGRIRQTQIPHRDPNSGRSTAGAPLFVGDGSSRSTTCDAARKHEHDLPF